MEQIVLDATVRATHGKGESRGLRREEMIPAVIYGKDMPALNLTLTRKDLAKALAGGATHKLISLRINENGSSQEQHCMIQEVQRDVFQKRVLHVDFHKISLTEKITTAIRVKLHGEAPGVKNGGILDHVLWEVEVEALPTQLPEALVMDVSELQIGHPLHVKDLPVPADVRILANPEDVVVVVHPPKVEVVETPAVVVGAVATSAQPEVIGKGKGEEEEASPPAKPEKEKK